MKNLASRKNLSLIGGALLLIVIIITASYSGYHYLQRSQSALRINNTYVSTEEYQQQLERRQNFLASQEQNIDESTLQRDITEQLIEDYLLREYAQTHGITPTEEEIETRYQQILQTIPEDELSQRLEELYGSDTDSYREVIAADIRREKVRSALDIPLRDWLAQRRSESQIERYLD